MQDVVIVKMGFRNIVNHHVFCIFDGHGGITCAHFVGRNFLQVLEKEMDNMTADTPEDIETALYNTFSKLDEMCEAVKIQHGSCALVVLLIGSTLYTACVGDSNGLVGQRNGSATALAKVVRPTDDCELRRIEEKGGFVSKTGRIGGVLAVSRTFGDLAFKPFVSAQPTYVAT